MSKDLTGMNAKVLIIVLVVLGFFVMLRTEHVLPSLEPSSGAAATTSPSPLSVKPTGKTLSVNGHAISIEIADSEEKRALGLGERSALADDAGMLFVFPRSDFQSIWMKGMRFSLDIIWLTPLNPPSSSEGGSASGGEEGGRKKGGDLIVVDIKENVAPETYPEVFYPAQPASYVLEMNGGAAKKSGITVGSTLVRER